MRRRDDGECVLREAAARAGVTVSNALRDGAGPPIFVDGRLADGAIALADGARPVASGAGRLAVGDGRFPYEESRISAIADQVIARGRSAREGCR